MSWSDRYNALPREVREITSAILSEHRIRDLRIYREKIVNAHKRTLADIDALIKHEQDRLASASEGQRTKWRACQCEECGKPMNAHPSVVGPVVCEECERENS